MGTVTVCFCTIHVRQDFSGSIDDVAVWDTALTAAEVTAVAGGASAGDGVQYVEDRCDSGNWAPRTKKTAKRGPRRREDPKNPG